VSTGHGIPKNAHSSSLAGDTVTERDELITL
jgi:hypothetical protein